MAFPKFGHGVTPQSDDSKVLVGSRGATTIIGVALAAIGLWAGWEAVMQVWHALGQLIVFLFALYVVAVATLFWVAKPYTHGLTRKELMLTLVWPLGVARYSRAGLRAMQSQVPTARSYGVSGDKVLLSPPAAKWLGVGISTLAAFLIMAGIGAGLGVIGHLVMLLVWLYVAGIAAQYWLTGCNRGQLTANKVVSVVAWPRSMSRNVQAGARQALTSPDEL